MLGTLIGAGLPILTALVGVGIATLIAMSLSGVLEMASVTPVLGLMLGLAVGIDYALFIVNRHRKQLKANMPLQESIGMANGFLKGHVDRKSTRLNSSHVAISYAVFCLKKKN